MIVEREELTENSVPQPSLIGLIRENNWLLLKERITKNPTEIHKWKDSSLPIHHACCHVNTIPISIIRTMIFHYPGSLNEVMKLNNALPIQIAVSCCDQSNGKAATNYYNIIKVLLDGNTNTAQRKDKSDCTILHDYLLNCQHPKIEMIKVLYNAFPSAIGMSDIYNYYPLHMVSRYGDWPVVEYILNLHPTILFIKSNNGKTPRDVAKELKNDKVCEMLFEEEIRKSDLNVKYAEVDFSSNVSSKASAPNVRRDKRSREK